jgi:hypothetical protein
MQGEEITLVMLFEKLLRVEIMLSEVLTNQKACSSFQLEGDDIIKGEETSPFVNPDTGLNDVNYYRSEHPKEKKEK